MAVFPKTLRDNAKIVITEHGISPTLLLGSLPVTVATESNGHKAGQPAKG